MEKMEETEQTKKRILITGAFGFIGSHITTWLYEKGYTVYALDTETNSQLGCKLIQPDGGDIVVGNSRYINYYLDKHPDKKEDFKNNVIPIIVDLLSNDTKHFLNNLIARYNIEMVIHLASPVGVLNILENKTVSNALRMNLMIHDVCKKQDIPLIFSSSSEIFGENNHIIDESNANIPNPFNGNRGGYAAQKLASEYLFKELDKAVSIRFFNITGIGHDSKMFIPEMINKIRKREPVQINEMSERIFSDITNPIIKDNILKIIEEKENFYKQSINIGYTKNMFIPENEYLFSLPNLFALMCETLIKDGIEIKLELVYNHYIEEINKRSLSYSILFKNEDNFKLDYRLLIEDMITNMNNYINHFNS